MQAGDQVSFELVSPRRLVVQVISTEDTKLPFRHSNDESSSMHGEDLRPPGVSPLVRLYAMCAAN